MRNRQGQASISWQARPFVVFRAVLAHGHILSAVLALPMCVALVEGQGRLAIALGLSAAFCLVAAAFGARFGAPDDLRENEAVCVFVLLFGLLSILPAPALAVLGMDPTDALFEAVSGITSTGLTMTRATADWPFSGHFLRAWLQWTGGFAIAVAGVAMIIGPSGAARAMGTVGIQDRDLLRSTQAQARDLLKVYAALTALASALMVMLLPTWQEGVAVALAAVSTGGFSPRADSLASYSTAAQIVTLLICLATSISLIAYVHLRQGDWAGAGRHSRALAFAAIALSGLVLVAGVMALSAPQETGPLHVALLNFLSGLSTAGFSTGPISAVPAYLALLLVAMLIGGGIGSTAGGIKFDRVLSLAAMVRLSLLRMRVPPRAMTSLRDGRAKVSANKVISIGAVLMCYAVSALVFWMAFLLSGEAPLASLFDVVSALSTVGLSSGVTTPDMPGHLKYVLMAAMLLGRLEFLALLLALSPGTWIRRS